MQLVREANKQREKRDKHTQGKETNRHRFLARTVNVRDMIIMSTNFIIELKMLSISDVWTDRPTNGRT